MLRALLHYGTLLEEGAARLGLVGRGDRGHVLMRHLTDALAPEILAWLPAQARVLDVGSGGGIPGIPWAILRPDIEMKLLEPRLRKAAFLERAILSLKLENVAVFEGTLEELGRQMLAAPWAVAVARAIRWTPAMVRAAGRLLAEDGMVVRYGAPEEPTDGVRVLGSGLGRDRAIQIWPRRTWERLPKAR